MDYGISKMEQDMMNLIGCVEGLSKSKIRNLVINPRVCAFLLEIKDLLESEKKLLKSEEKQEDSNISEKNEGLKNLHPDIIAAIINPEREMDVDLLKLKAGTKLEVQTQNTLYTIEILEEGATEVLISGGSYFPETKKAFFNGSTFGGSMLKIGHVGFGMYMEITIPVVGTITTSSCKSCKIIGKDFEYILDWGKHEDK